MFGLVVELEVCVLVSLRRLECRLAILVILSVEPWLVARIWSQVGSPPTGGSASMKLLLGVL